MAMKGTSAINVRHATPSCFISCVKKKSLALDISTATISQPFTFKSVRHEYSLLPPRKISSGIFGCLFITKPV